MKSPRLLICFLTSFVLLLLFSCQKDTVGSIDSGGTSLMSKSGVADRFNTYYSQPVSMGNGKVRSWIRISHSGVPQELGVEMSPDAFENLPNNHEEGTYVVPLHSKAIGVTPFKYVLLNWNSAGHPPPGIYNSPHFDFHFYMLSNEERKEIPAYADAPSQFDHFPPPGHLPPSYVPTPGGEPKMGKHWVDITSPEFHGSPFTATYIYGTYDGEVIFGEPMITLALLQAGASHSWPIPQPALYHPSGTYYPTQYKAYKNVGTGAHIVSLSDFVLR